MAHDVALMFRTICCLCLRNFEKAGQDIQRIADKPIIGFSSLEGTASSDVRVVILHG